MFPQRRRETLEHADLRDLGPADPIVENPPNRRLARLPPDLAEALLHVVRDRQRRVEVQRGRQPFRLVAFVIQVLRVLQEQPKRSFEKLAGVNVGQLAVQFAAKGAELVVVELDHVEVVEDVEARGRCSRTARMYG
jgi:hypothetical protein